MGSRGATSILNLPTACYYDFPHSLGFAWIYSQLSANKCKRVNWKLPHKALILQLWFLFILAHCAHRAASWPWLCSVLGSCLLVDQKASASTATSSKRPPGGKKHNTLPPEHDGMTGCTSNSSEGSKSGQQHTDQSPKIKRSDSGEADIEFYSKNQSILFK